MSMTVIEHIEVGSGGAASITFTSTATIPTDYTDLMIVYSARTDRSATDELVLLSFNGETTGFSSRYLDGTGSAVSSGTFARFAGTANGATSTSNTFSNVNIYFPNYRSSANKSYSCDMVLENNATFGQQIIIAGLRSDTDPIDSITLTPNNGNNFVQYSSATLYGIRKYDTAGSPKATGGIISFDSANNKWVHTFTASGTFTPTENLTAEYLVVAGGGGAASWAGGGGGAGGYRSSVSGESSGGGASAESALSLTASTGYTVTVGAGGAGAPSDVNSGSTGSNSVFSTITSNGGGGGGYTIDGLTGGSGGGAGFALANIGGAATSNQGYAGGDNNATSVTPNYAGAGGGGAGSVGGNATPTSAGDGGSGVTSSITGVAIGRAGGGGGSFSGANVGSASDGGGAGGDVFSLVNRENGTANTGGGGGSGRTSGGSGGSGIVIVRYSA